MSLLDLTHLLLHSSLFFFNDTATTEIYTLSLHDALPIFYENLTGRMALESLMPSALIFDSGYWKSHPDLAIGRFISIDRKSTRLNSSHDQISYAVFCLKKKNHIVAPRIC